MKIFHNAIHQSSFNWNSGYANVQETHAFIIDRLLECYNKLEDEKQKYSYSVDNRVRKTNDVEVTIVRYPDQVFSKADIQKLHPNVSAKTIERTLERLQQEGMIESLGTGRSAKWMKKKKILDGFDYERMAFDFDDDILK